MRRVKFNKTDRCAYGVTLDNFGVIIRAFTLVATIKAKLRFKCGRTYGFTWSEILCGTGSLDLFFADRYRFITTWWPKHKTVNIDILDETDTVLWSGNYQTGYFAARHNLRDVRGLYEIITLKAPFCAPYQVSTKRV